MQTSPTGVGSRRLGLAGRVGFACGGGTGQALTGNMGEGMSRGEEPGGEMFPCMEWHLHQAVSRGLQGKDCCVRGQ